MVFSYCFLVLLLVIVTYWSESVPYISSKIMSAKFYCKFFAIFVQTFVLIELVFSIEAQFFHQENFLIRFDLLRGSQNVHFKQDHG